MGRPKSEVTNAKDIARIERMASRGVSLASIARAVGLTSKTLRRIRRDDPDGPVDSAIEAGRGVLESRLVSALYAAATRKKNPYTPAAMFLLKAMFAWRDAGPDAGGQTNVQVNVALPPPLTPDDYQRLVVTAESKRLSLTAAEEQAHRPRRSKALPAPRAGAGRKESPRGPARS